MPWPKVCSHDRRSLRLVGFGFPMERVDRSPTFGVLEALKRQTFPTVEIWICKAIFSKGLVGCPFVKGTYRNGNSEVSPCSDAFLY